METTLISQILKENIDLIDKATESLRKLKIAYINGELPSFVFTTICSYTEVIELCSKKLYDSYVEFNEWV